MKNLNKKNLLVGARRIFDRVQPVQCDMHSSRQSTTLRRVFPFAISAKNEPSYLIQKKKRRTPRDD